MKPPIISPKRRTPELNRLLEMVGSSYEPEQVPVVLDGPTDPSQLFQCYLVVRERINREGGTMVCGWLIAKTDIVYQAQHHAVWAPPDSNGTIICITPKVFEQDQIMFLRDDRYPYKDRDIPSYRVAEPISSVVEDLIILQRIKEVMEAQFEYVSDRGQIVPARFKEPYGLIRMREQEWIAFISKGGRLTSPCFCNRGKLYRDCHGFQMREKGQALLREFGLHLEWMP